MSNCELCRQSLGAAAQIVCGLELCDQCFDGDFAGRLTGRGFEVTAKEWVERSVAQPGTTWIQTRVTGTAALATALSVTFTHEGQGIRIQKFTGEVHSEVLVGDPLFDDAVLVETETRELTRRALKSDGLQMTILDAATDFGSIRFQPVPGGCRVALQNAEGSPCTDPATVGPRLVAIALHYLERALAG